MASALCHSLQRHTFGHQEHRESTAILELENKQRYFLKKEDRLKSRKAIEMLFAKGAHFSNFPFRVFRLLVEGDAGLKTGFTASSKSFKKAVDRNRIKRLMRESYRLQKHVLDEKIPAGKELHLFFIYTGKELPDYDFIFEKTGAALKRIAKLINENAE
jgi:ribonuclease P protein component